MLVVGSDDGVYGVSGLRESGEPDVRNVLDTGRVRRVRSFEAIEGVFAATKSGLYHSPAGEEWSALDVPREQVYAVGASPDGSRLFAGTRPAHVYVAEWTDGALSEGDPAWRELEGFQRLPSREEWGLPRHEHTAQVRDVHVHPSAPDRVVAGVEVGGVHVSEDGGDAWTERRDGVNDDVHELRLVGPDEFVAATGFGLYRSTDAGRSWTRLDEGFDQRYFRAVFSNGGRLYAAGALANSSTWEDDDADPGLFASEAGEPLAPVDHPRPDETITGLTAVDGTVVAATHRGSLLLERADGWTTAGSFPVPGEVTGRYTPLSWLGD